MNGVAYNVFKEWPTKIHRVVILYSRKDRYTQKNVFTLKKTSSHLLTDFGYMCNCTPDHIQLPQRDIISLFMIACSVDEYDLLVLKHYTSELNQGVDIPFFDLFNPSIIPRLSDDLKSFIDLMSKHTKLLFDTRHIIKHPLSSVPKRVPVLVKWNDLLTGHYYLADVHIYHIMIIKF